MKETFKQHPVYSSYMIGDKGTVNGIRKNNIGYTKSDGYRYAWIINEGFRYVHRLVWETFVGEIPKGYEINHKDGNKANCALNNLELTSHSDNIKHSYNVLGRTIPKGDKHWNYGKSFSKETKQLMSEKKKGVNHPKFKGWYIIDGVKYASATLAAKECGISYKTVIRRCKSNQKGFYFEPS